MTKPYTISVQSPTAIYNFILNSWMRSQRNHRVFTSVPNDTYFSKAADLITPWLEHDDTWVYTAHEHGDPDNVFGYMVVNQGCILYAYTKANFRKNGIQADLYKAANSPKQTNYLFGRFTPSQISINPFFVPEGK